jgi:hypothetical protein
MQKCKAEPKYKMNKCNTCKNAKPNHTVEILKALLMSIYL